MHMLCVKDFKTNILKATAKVRDNKKKRKEKKSDFYDKSFIIFLNNETLICFINQVHVIQIQ